jgi:cyclophilin family peptidyl-prolyl cis-trans isomerase/HEAT repeat protein
MKLQFKCLLLSLALSLVPYQACSIEQINLSTQTTVENSQSPKSNEVSPTKLWYLVDQRDLDQTYFSQAIQHSDTKLAIMAIKGVGRIGGDKAVPLLLEPLTANQAEIRRAAAFSLGISGTKLAVPHLWQRLTNEQSSDVRQEIYLALGNLAPTDIIAKLLNKHNNEKQPEVIASIFQALGFAMTFHPEIANNIDMKKSQSVIDFAAILALMERDDLVAYHAGHFLARIKKLEKRISPAQLQRFTNRLKDINNKKVLAKLIGKIAKRSHLANRRLLSWLIEQSEHSDVGLATESIRAMGKLVHIPQAKIQLGKLQASKSTLISQTALRALAESNLQSREIKALFKKQLKSEHPGIVVEAIRGLLERQERQDMVWALKILSHKNTYVKIKFAQLIFAKDPKGFSNVISMLAKNSDPLVAEYAGKLLSNSDSSTAQNSPIPTKLLEYPLNLNTQLVRLNTTQGAIDIRLNNQTPYTSLNFIRLVESGYYNNSYFSRVIGNFVAQGGDNIGDGNGSSGETIREELSYLPHKTGAVGMATSGKDTGDSQFYINLANNKHLDRHYTVFGQVESGMDVAFRLSNGDQILSAEVLE